MTDWNDTDWTEKDDGGIEFKITRGLLPTKIYGTVCQAHKDAIDVGLINNDHCLNCVIDRLTAELDSVYALSCGPVEQAKMVKPLTQWVSTRFVHVEKHNDAITKLKAEIAKQQQSIADYQGLLMQRDAEIERLR